jgi:ketosteroid isomerase-like protein
MQTETSASSDAALPRPGAEGFTRDQASKFDRFEAARSAFDAFARRDIPALLALAHPEIELIAPGTAALARGGRTYRGHSGIFSYFRDATRVWDELDLIPQDFEEVGDRVLVFGRLRARGGGGLIVDEPAHWVLEFQGERVIRACAHSNRMKALEEARKTAERSAA